MVHSGDCQFIVGDRTSGAEWTLFEASRGSGLRSGTLSTALRMQEIPAPGPLFL